MISSTAGQPLIISEQAEGTSEISVLNNHTQDLTPNEMMRESHRSRQISAACFALALESPPPPPPPSLSKTYLLTHNRHIPAPCPLHLQATIAGLAERRTALHTKVRLDGQMMKIHLFATCWRRNNMEGRLGLMYNSSITAVFPFAKIIHIMRPCEWRGFIRCRLNTQISQATSYLCCIRENQAHWHI